jgi:hypothetical protein
MEVVSRLQVVPEAEPVPQPSTIAAAGLGDTEEKARPLAGRLYEGGSSAPPIHSSSWFRGRRARKIENGDLIEEDGVVYDQSLLKAMYKTVWQRWWLGVILKGLGGRFHIYPLP